MQNKDDKVNFKKKCIAIVPIKSRSTRVTSKNLRPFNGVPLYQFVLDNLSKLKPDYFDEIYVDSDNEQIQQYCESHDLKFIQRLPELALDSANGNDLLNYHCSMIDADLYFQIFITSPLLKLDTIKNCITHLSSTQENDSILTAVKRNTWFWYEGSPVNYNPKSLPRSQDAKPLVQETTGLYGITKDSLVKNKCRIGDKPFFYYVNEIEATDIDNPIDFEIAEILSRTTI